MPKPTLTELVREAERSIAVLEERSKGIDACRESDKQFAEELKQLSADFATLRQEFATVREKVVTLEKSVDQITERRWTLAVAIVSAFLGGFLTLLIQFSLRALPK